MAARRDLGRAQALLAVAFAVALAFAAGATSAPEARPLALEIVARGLRQPTHVTAAPGEPARLYVTERAGRVRVVEDGKVQPRPFLDIASRVRSGGLLGLFSLAFHPSYRSDRRAYVMYSGKDGAVHVAELRVRNGAAHVSRTLLRIPMPNDRYAHVGGQLAFGPRGKLYVGVGDGLDGAAAQDPSSLLGKIVRLDVDKLPSGPPVAVVASGLRNPWRFSFDRATGDLFIGDVGELHWEEIDVVRRGAAGVPNFGWDAYEGHKRNPRGRAEPPSDPVQPLVVYAHRKGGCAAVIGGFVYRGRAIPGVRGRYFYGDTCTGAIWSIRAGSRFPVPRREPFGVAQLTSFGEDGAGELYLVGFGSGALCRLTVRT